MFSSSHPSMTMMMQRNKQAQNTSMTCFGSLVHFFFLFKYTLITFLIDTKLHHHRHLNCRQQQQQQRGGMILTTLLSSSYLSVIQRQNSFKY